MSVCGKFQLPSLSRGGLKVPGGKVGRGVVGCGSSDPFYCQAGQ